MPDSDPTAGTPEAVEPAEPIAAQPRSRRLRSSARPVAAGIVIAALAVASVLLGVDHRAADHDRADRSAFLQAARQAVIDLTTVSADHPDADVARILAVSTGPFHDDFTSRAKTFTSVVEQSHVSTTGTVTEAGIESISGDQAKVLVAATSTVTNTAGAHDEPRTWRLRLALQRTQGRILVTNVDFVP